MTAKGRLRPSGMNRLEEAYAERLEQQKAQGIILRFWFEGVKLRLADRTFITVDFFVLRANLELEAHEVKGGWFPEHNRAKLKVAAELYPFRFYLCRRPTVKSEWVVTEL